MAGALFGLAGMWAFAAFFIRLVKDVPLGPVNIWARGEAYRESERRNVEGQNRVYHWTVRLWPVPVICVVTAVVLIAIASR